MAWHHDTLAGPLIPDVTTWLILAIVGGVFLLVGKKEVNTNYLTLAGWGFILLPLLPIGLAALEIGCSLISWILKNGTGGGNY